MNKYAAVGYFLLGEFIIQETDVKCARFMIMLDNVVAISNVYVHKLVNRDV